jgi:hypothetical protein
LNTARKKKQIIYEAKYIKIIADFSMETLKQEGHGVRYSRH